MSKSQPLVFTGLGLSLGAVEGTIHKASTLEELDNLDDGQILVVPRSSPAWTAGMLRAGGFICEEGGVICHAAIVARELGLPCVVNIPGILNQLADGTRVKLEVQGTQGTVHVIE